MFLSALQPYVVVIIIAIVAVQYAIALFCLLKLAYLDISKREYVLWNLFILIVVFVGDIAFLIYYYKVGKNKRIPPYVPPVESDEVKNEDKEEPKSEEETPEPEANAEQLEGAQETQEQASDETPAQEQETPKE